MRDVEDVLVLPRADHAHRVVHRHLVKRVRSVDDVPARRALLVDDRQQRAAGHRLSGLESRPIQDRRREVDETRHRLIHDARAPPRLRQPQRQRQSQ